MKKIKKRDKQIRSTVGKIMIGLALVSMVGGLSALPAFGQPRHWGPPRGDRYYGDRYYHRRGYYYPPPPPVFLPPPPPPPVFGFFPRPYYHHWRR